MRSRSISVVIAGVVCLAGAAAVAATVVEKAHFKGRSAFTVCRASQVITCDFGAEGRLETDVFVEGFDFWSTSLQFPDEARNRASATIRRTNTCTGESSASVGGLDGGYSRNGLQSAHIEGSIPLIDFDTEDPAGTIVVAVTWEGFGDTTQERDHIKFDFETPEGDPFIAIRTSGRTRSATASGTLILNGEPISCEFDGGTLMDNKIGNRETLH